MAIKTSEQGMTKELFDYKLDALEVRLDQVERKVSRKADDVVSTQVLQHRSELEEILETIEALDQQMKNIETRLNRFVGHLNRDEQESVLHQKPNMILST